MLLINLMHFLSLNLSAGISGANGTIVHVLLNITQPDFEHVNFQQMVE